MSYTALYRKLRPKTFGDVIGQQFIIKTLLNQIISERISHAYLFCGTRGTGKTSVAKIFAKAINCTNSNNGEPCNKCDVCLSIYENRNLNVIEIDAASNNGVENIRDIREEVKYPPTLGKYKIYIIDEVHMLSTGAFNALLKTLEEPPEHVIFILATTDPQKIPQTILSRCQRFDFRRIAANEMIIALKKYSAEEQIDIEDNALKYIAQVSDGAMRDALSILDMSTSFYFNTKIKYENILDLVGAVDTKVLFDITDALSNSNTNKVIEIINEITERGRDVVQFVNELLIHLRNLLVSLNINNTSTSLNYSQENILLLKEQCKKVGYEKLMLYINSFSELQSKIKYSSNAKILLEVTCIKLCTAIVENDINSLIVRLQKLESSIKTQNFTKIKPIEKKEDKKVKLEKIIPDDINQLKSEWNSFINNFNPVIKTILKMSDVGYINDKNNNEFLLIITENSINSSLLKESDNFNVIKNALLQKLNKDFNLNILNKDEYNLKHKEVYGANDEELAKFKGFTEKINMNIIIEE